MPSPNYNAALLALAVFAVDEKVPKSEVKADIVDTMNRVRRDGLKPDDAGTQFGGPTAKSLRMDEWGSIVWPDYGQRVFSRAALKLATTDQQRANIMLQCSVDENGNDVPGGPGPFGWGDGIQANALGIPLQRETGRNSFGAPLWEDVDGRDEIGADGKPHVAWLFPRLRTKAKTFDELAKLLASLPPAPKV